MSATYFAEVHRMIQSDIVKAQSELEKNRPVRAWKLLEAAFNHSRQVTLLAEQMDAEASAQGTAKVETGSK